VLVALVRLGLQHRHPTRCRHVSALAGGGQSHVDRALAGPRHGPRTEKHATRRRENMLHLRHLLQQPFDLPSYFVGAIGRSARRHGQPHVDAAVVDGGQEFAAQIAGQPKCAEEHGERGGEYEPTKAHGSAGRASIECDEALQAAVEGEDQRVALQAAAAFHLGQLRREHRDQGQRRAQRSDDSE
jgi:hypothetical protein